MKFKIIGTLLLLLLQCSICFAQTKKISGVVRDAVDGSTLPGVTVTVKGSTTATLTDLNGEFVINAAVRDALVFTFIGKNPIEEVVGNRNILEITMADNEKLLDEVVVVAFGSQKKSSVIASIQSVNLADLKVPASNLTSALAGKIPGVISYQTTGEPGADNAQFFIRGVTTFGYKTSPLILIDEFEGTTDDLARLQPDDIESFSILKDASATVLYGARGANGIIMIKTKSGVEGAVKMSARVDMNVSKPTRTTEFADGVTYMNLYNEARMTRNPILGPYYDEQKIQATAKGLNPMIYPNVNWYDDLFKKQTINTRANMNVSGGGKVATYFVSGGFENETGLLNVDKRSNFNNNIDIKRVNVRTNVVFKLTPTTTLDTRMTGRFERFNGPYNSVKDLYNLVMNSNPVDFPAYYAPDAANEFTDHILFGNTFADGRLKGNPYAFMVNGFENKNENTMSIQGTLSQDLKFITENLKFQLKGSTNQGKRMKIAFLFIDSKNVVSL